ncbi:MAG TPA: tetraacyldisaccharide 4'-kinase, partial [Chitinophagaceae bacterium]|nr:tetraacyldisaccharide 4'-kinase [Chitinophagaceae bacterium]
MNFNAPLVKTIRFILFPVSLLYWLVIWVRNRLFDLGIIRSVSFKLPIICVGIL